MPNFNGMGPNGAGPMTGRGHGRCGGAQSFDAGAESRGFGRGMGSGRGMGNGQGMGSGRGCGGGNGGGMSYGRGMGMGWLAMGYGDTVPQVAVQNALEARKAFLNAELARTESLLAQSAAAPKSAADESGEA